MSSVIACKGDISNNANFDRGIFKQVLGADEKIILKCILKNTCMGVCIGVFWLRTVFNGKLLWTGRLRLKCDGTRAETRFRLSAKWTSPFKSAGASVQSRTGSRGVLISGSNGSNAGYTMFRDSVKSTGYSLHSSVYPSLHLLCVTVCHHTSTGL